MIIHIFHKEASETVANSSGVRKEASERLNLNNPRQTECSLGLCKSYPFQRLDETRSQIWAFCG